jgi:hypothetical protein
MREIHTDGLRSNEFTKNTENNFSAVGLLALKDASHSHSGSESSSMRSLLPTLTIEANTAHATKPTGETRPLAAGREQTRPLTADEYDTASSIENSILTGDLNRLQRTLNRFSGHGQALDQVMAKVKRDMAGHGITVAAWRSNNQMTVMLGEIYGNVSLTMSTDRRQPAQAAKVEIVSDSNGHLGRMRTALDPKKTLDEIRR